MSLYTLDFRHFFHEVGVSENLSRYFGVCIDGNYYRWRTMPMGFAFSPFCAQSIAWAAILYATIKDGEEDPDFIIPKGLKKLPTTIEVRGGGFVTNYYDNLLLCGSHTDVTRIAKRIRKSFERFNIEVKEGSEELRSAHDLVTQPLVYLGAAMFFERNREGSLVFSWKQCSKKLDKWRALQLCADPDSLDVSDPWAKNWTRRELAAFIGRVLWRRSLSHHYPRSGTAPIIKLLRRMITNENGKGMLDPRKWDARDFQLDTDEEKLAREAWTDVLSNPPHHYDDIPHPSHHIVVATDSSDGYGYVMYDSEGNVIEEIARTWDVEFPGWKSQPPTQSFKWSERHIYLKELKAAIDFLSELSGRFPNTVFDIGIDNTAAMAAIKNIYSGSYEACEWLDAFHEKLQGNHCIVSAWGVRSEDNALDPSSRQCYDPTNSVHTCKDKGLAKRCWNHIQAQKKGYHPGPREGARPYAGGAVGIRHEEVLDLDDVGPGEIVEKIHMLSK